MVPSIENILKDFVQEIIGTIAKPSTDYLFESKNNKDSHKLPKAQEISFHSNVAKLLFISNHVWHHILSPVVFLTTRVKKLMKIAGESLNKS